MTKEIWLTLGMVGICFVFVLSLFLILHIGGKDD
jgi:hypothetical protein